MKPEPIPELVCMCASLRRAARALTRNYDARVVGFTSTQFTVLQVLWRSGEISQGRLGYFLVMDSTTLTRTLRNMVRAGWILERRGDDRRERLLRLSKTGTKALKHALPAWEKAQAELRRKLGSRRWSEAQKLLNEIASISNNLGEI